MVPHTAASGRRRAAVAGGADAAPTRHGTRTRGRRTRSHRSDRAAGGGGAARHITVDTDYYTALFTSAGARLESLQFKQYRTSVNPNSPLQEAIVPGQGRALPFGVELRGARPLSDRGAAYAVDGGDLTLRGDQSGSVSFTWRGEGGTVTKRFSFRGDRYEFQLVVEARDVAREFQELGVDWSKTVESQPQPGSEIIFDRTIYLDGRKFTEDQFNNLTDGKIVSGQIVWAGYAGKHFVSAMIPVPADTQRLWLKLRDQTVQQQLLFPLADGALTQALDVYVGPKDFDVLAEVGHNLSRAVNMGWFEFIAVPLLHLLEISYRYTGNYGVSIILLTMLIKVLFIPLTQRSFRSMREMQKLQPQMARTAREVQGRFGDDEPGDHGVVQAPQGEPARRLPADGAADPGVHRPVQRAAQLRGDAPRAVHLVDHRPVGAGPPRVAAASVRAWRRYPRPHVGDGREHVRAADG